MRTYAVFLLAIAPSLSASQPPASLQLPPVVVEDTFPVSPTPLDGADSTRITAEDLEKQQSLTLVDALRALPGATVTQNGGLGQLASVSLRGAENSHTAVILDGVRLNDVSGLNGAVDLSPWMNGELAEIQVIQGPFSSLYGPDAIGGVILMETKKGKGAAKVFARGEAGSYQTYAQTAGMQGEKGPVNYHVSASRLQSAGSPLTPDAFRPQLQGKADDPLHQENITARIDVGQDTANLTFFSRYLDRRSGFRSGAAYDPWRQNLAQQFYKFQGHYEKGDGRGSHDASHDISHDVSLAWYSTDRANKNPAGLAAGENKGAQIQADWRQTHNLSPQLQAQLALELAQERFHSLYEGIPVVQARSDRGGIGTALAYKITDPLTLTFSARTDKYQGLPAVLTWRAGGEYLIHKITFRGSIGTGFKAPTLAQRFFKSPFYYGNPDLKPERSVGWDVGVQSPFFHDRLTLALTWFHNRIRDMIVWGMNTPTNARSAYTQGLESKLDYLINKDWSATFSHTCMQTKDEQTGQRLLRRPSWKLALKIAGTLNPQWRLSGTILSVGPQADVAYNNYLVRVRTPGYTVLGVQASCRLNSQWQVYGRGDNILNRRYQSPDGYQQPGSGIYLGMRGTW